MNHTTMMDGTNFKGGGTTSGTGGGGGGTGANSNNNSTCASSNQTTHHVSRGKFRVLRSSNIVTKIKSTLN